MVGFSYPQKIKYCYARQVLRNILIFNQSDNIFTTTYPKGKYHFA
jgi:hypothetical protein